MTSLALPNVPADVLNGLATGAVPRQTPVAAAGSRVRVIFGRQIIAADIFFVGTLGNDLILGCGWGLSPLDAIEQIYINSAAPSASVTVTNYLGDPTQGVDATLAAARAGYNDTLVATFAGRQVAAAYTVLRIPGAAASGFPRVEAIVRGRKVYDPRENLLTYSEQFNNAAWAKINGAGISTNSAVAPDGTMTADTLFGEFSTNSIIHQSPNCPVGSTYTYSLYVKNVDALYTELILAPIGGGIDGYMIIFWSGSALTSVSGSSSSNPGFIDVGGGWYRVWYTVTVAQANGLWRIYPSYSVAGVKSIYAWGAQLNKGSRALGYVSTLASQVTPIWQNRLTYSAQFDNAAWGIRWGGSATITANIAGIFAPDGTQTCDRITATVGGSGAGQACATVAGRTYTFSIWVRSSAAGARIGAFTVSNGGAGADPRTLTIGSNGSVLTRYSLTWTETVTGTRYMGAIVNNGETIEVWGAQLNDGATAYDYTPTIAASVDGTYSTNPALILRDFLASPIYGQGLTVDSVSVTDVASACDQLLSDGAKRRELNIVIDKAGPAAQWADVMAEYAGCFIVRDGAVVKLVPNRPAAAVAALTAANIIAGSMRLTKRSGRRAPTVVRVNYTDTSSVPWQDKPAYAYASGVLSGTTPWREESVDMPGIVTYAQALRAATERLNAAVLTDLDAEFSCFDESLAYEEGDVVSITYPHHGLAAKLMRIRTIEHERPGRRRVTANEYSAAVYSDDVAAGPGADSQLPSPDSIDPPTAVTIESGSAHLLLLADGTILSRMLVTWTAPSNLYYDRAEVEFQRNGDSEWTRAPSLVGSAYCSPVQDGTAYSVRVRAVNSFGIESAWVTTAHVVVGKTEPPPPPQSFLVSTYPDGTRRFTWQPPVTPPLDLYGYEIRYKLGTGHTWASMTPLHDGVLISSPYETNQLAAGTYTLAIVSVDTTGNESSAVYITGTLPDPRLAGVLEIEEPHTLGWPGTKTNCWVDPNTGQLLATDSKQWSSFPTDAVTWANWNQWARASNALTYTHTNIDVGIITKFTPLVSVSGVGTQTIEIRTSNDGTTWSSWAAPSGPVTARYLGARVTMTGSGARLDTMTIILDAAPVTEDINDLATSSLTGSNRIGTGDIRVPITKTYGLIRIVTVMLQNVGPGWSVEVIDKTTAVGPRIKIYNASNVLADATIDVNVRGV